MLSDEPEPNPCDVEGAEDLSRKTRKERLGEWMEHPKCHTGILILVGHLPCPSYFTIAITKVFINKDRN